MMNKLIVTQKKTSNIKPFVDQYDGKEINFTMKKTGISLKKRIKQ